MKNAIRSLMVFCLGVALCMVLPSCRNHGTPYDEFEILPLEEAPMSPEAPDADASIAAENRDAAVEEPEDCQAIEEKDAEAPSYYAQASLRSKTLQAGEILSVDIKLGSKNGGMDGEGTFHTFLNGQKYESVGGVIHFEMECSTPGTYYLQGAVYRDMPGGTEKYPYSESYTVE